MHLDLRSPRRLAGQRVRDALVAIRARWSATLVVAALGALILGLSGAAAGQYAGWSTAGPLPTDSDAAAIARLALGGPAPQPQRREYRFGYGPDGVYGPGHVRFTVPADPAAAAFVWRTKDVRVRLDTAGWRIDQASPPGLLFVADKGDWRVRYSTGGVDRVHLDIVRRQPLWVLPAGAVGGLLGAGLGWVAALWAARRWRRLVGRPRRLAAGLAGLGGVALLPVLVVVSVQQIGGHAELARPQIPLWTSLMQPVIRPLTMAAAVALLGALAVAGFARTGKS